MAIEPGEPKQEKSMEDLTVSELTEKIEKLHQESTYRVDGDAPENQIDEEDERVNKLVIELDKYLEQYKKLTGEDYFKDDDTEGIR